MNYNISFYYKIRCIILSNLVLFKFKILKNRISKYSSITKNLTLKTATKNQDNLLKI